MKNRKIKAAYFAALIIFAIAAVLLVVFLTDSGAHRRETTIVLPGHEGAQSDASGAIDIPAEQSYNGREVKIDTENVLSVIKAMRRPDKYYLEMETAVYAGETARTCQVKHWVSGDSSVTRRKEDGASSAVYTMRTPENVKMWYENSADVYTGALAQLSADDAAGIMTYEDVLKESGTLISARYTDLDNFRCIYVSARDKLLGYTREYYIDADTGLLVKSVTTKAGETVYSMSVSVLSLDISDMDRVFEN